MALAISDHRGTTDAVTSAAMAVAFDSASVDLMLAVDWRLEMWQMTAPFMRIDTHDTALHPLCENPLSHLVVILWQWG